MTKKTKKQQEQEERIKQEKLKKLTWKYFWIYKFWEILALGGIMLVSWLLIYFQKQLIDFFTKNQVLLGQILGWIILVLVVAFIVFIWIAINWSKARDTAKTKLGMRWYE